MSITISPDLPYFSATADCDWDLAARIAADLGQEHLDAVHRAAALAEAEALLDDLDDGWNDVSPETDSDYLALVGMPPIECIRYRDGTYDCSDGEARSNAIAELRRTIRALS